MKKGMVLSVVFAAFVSLLLAALAQSEKFTLKMGHVASTDEPIITYFPGLTMWLPTALK